MHQHLKPPSAITTFLVVKVKRKETKKKKKKFHFFLYLFENLGCGYFFTVGEAPFAERLWH